jgi:hypothetical protein
VNIVERIRGYVATVGPGARGRGAAGPAPERAAAVFDVLALEAFGYQFERVAPYRAMCQRAGRTPASVTTWRDVPLVPATAFASVELATDAAVETFRSSGTLGPERSVHRHPFPDLYRAVVDATFPAFCLPPGAGAPPPMLALVAPRDVAPDSSLAFMIAHVLERFGGADSRYGVGARGVEIGICRSWLGAHQRAGAPALVLATALALADLLERLERMNLHFRLPPGSAVFETGGFKGRRRETSREALAAATTAWLGIPAERIVSEYGMTELTSQAYSDALAGGAGDLFVAPPWMRVRALHPETLAGLPHGETGLLAIFDLANVGSALHVLTEDLGRTEPGGFRLEGRAPEADLRGCSLLAEELGRPPEA